MSIFPTIFPVTSHTEHVGPGSTFVVVKGMKEDGMRYIPLALERGATRIVLEEGALLASNLIKKLQEKNIDVMYVPSARRALAELSAQAYNYPARSLKIIAVTGTKGKTTTSYLLEHVLRSAGFKTALLSTAKNRIGDTFFEASLTTAQPDYLHTFFSLSRSEGVEYVVMEVAAQAQTLYRVATLSFEAVIFTNFSLDHSEFYATQEEYFQAKCALFNQLSLQGRAIINADDARVKECALQVKDRVTFSVANQGDCNAQVLKNDLNGLSFVVDYAGISHTFHMNTLLGKFSVSNILAVLAVTEKLGIPFASVEQSLQSFEGVPGRLQRFILPNGAVAFIDTAHTPSSFEALLSTLRPLTTHLMVVFGAGGDRDALKRPLMGAIAATYADALFITTDNPRSEDPQMIIEAIAAGIESSLLSKIHCELDREKAIRLAYQVSSAGSIIALLGKGPVEYQHMKDTKVPFSEAAILRSL